MAESSPEDLNGSSSDKIDAKAPGGQMSEKSFNIERPPHAFRIQKSAILTLFVSLLLYLYQSKLFGLNKQPETVSLDGQFGFGSRSRSGPQAEFVADIPKRDAIVNAFKHAWSAYERDAMGNDEYYPLSKRGSNLVDAGGIGYTIVDAIDTIQLMGLQEEYQRAKDWIANNLTFERDGSFNTFETTIRVLGGLLAAYHLSDQDPLFLEKAKDLANRIMPVFDTPSGLPRSLVNLAKKQGFDEPNMPNIVSTAEAATLQLELKYLSFLTGEDEYWDKAEGVMRVIKATSLPSGLAAIYMSAEAGVFLISEIRLGSRGDSFYEYLLKQYLQTDKSEPMYLEMYQSAMEGIHTTLVHRGLNKGLVYTAEVHPDPQQRQADGQMAWRLMAKQDHLVCFLGGSLMLGATTTGLAGISVSVPPLPSELTETGQKDWQLGYELIETCMDTHNTATGLAPEISHFYTAENGDVSDDKDWYIKITGTNSASPSYDSRYILRPETIESLFIAYRLTGNQKYRDHGWKIFQAIEKFCRADTGGYISILNVDDVNSEKIDKMETFFLSETLKYLYLLFSDSEVLPLDKYVFNTEAHPLPIFTP
ncbi:glycoside hydrolase family 47 protein [Gymnopilus junonius]|uniref:alpha-1,2-Mannosidase n=1 Tax=Gymnopilus junonius TaxID=109634 RepID=A0A9P5NV29_GYMJU|nr:glycoside hydrolase family 47 protein [Gymnopilus junonius]